jgi:hypothetical protein
VLKFGGSGAAVFGRGIASGWGNALGSAPRMARYGDQASRSTAVRHSKTVKPTRLARSRCIGRSRSGQVVGKRAARLKEIKSGRPEFAQHGDFV